MDYPFRIQSEATSFRRLSAIRAQGDIAPTEPQAGADRTQQYLARVIKLIPAEVVALYQGVHGIVSSAAIGNDAAAKAFLPIIPWVSLALVIFVRSWGTRDTTGSWKSVQVGAVIIASVSFAVWVVSLSHSVAGLPELRPWIGSILLMTWPFFIPYFYKGS